MQVGNLFLTIFTEQREINQLDGLSRFKALNVGSIQITNHRNGSSTLLRHKIKNF